MSLSVKIKHDFGDFTLDVAFEAGPGVTAVFGPSGAGKTSVANAVAGLFAPEQGMVTLGNRCLYDPSARVNVPPHKRRIGTVFQDGRLFPHLSVAGNLDFGARYIPRGSKIPNRDQVISLMEIGALLDRRPMHLSGGEKQRVALARALLMAPELLVMDEPLAALDGPRKDEILPYLERFTGSNGVPVLYVSHSVAEIARLADQIVVLRAGRVIRCDAVSEVLSDPEMVPLMGVREAGSVLRAKILGHDSDGLSRLAVSGGILLIPRVQAEPGNYIRLRVLAQDILLSLEAPVGLSSRNILPVMVLGLHRGDGPGVAVSLQLGDERLLARVTARAAQEMHLRPGLECHAILKATAVPRGDIGIEQSGDQSAKA
ncbi:molybdenum ABC transporter ATP-binding protein [Roseovarius pelagicus]|uniref:Molybdenum ABC transporter ATP-binding protein n=1 Tax=Roseovarius pelagicus TaxID=2980108 RepID=A0ABY6DA05_9RHOB|nr:molybdenum ABC transporter ATP-binding protein [Roseovarius pelagicus]UXX82967.1 molybdenum ABC transporter ATP-binding protein [Roseovarius pelagicus]